MLDFGGATAMPVKETPTKPPSKLDDCLGPRSTTKRPQGDMKDTMLKGGTVGTGDGDELMLDITCGQNQAALYMSRLQLGSKGTCVLFENSWLTPNEFQYISGRETAKDWKRSIKHHGKSLKVLISKGILTTSPLRCNCGHCTQNKDKDVAKYIVTDDVKTMSTASLRDVFTTDLSKLVNPEIAKVSSDRRYFCAPGESIESKKNASSESTVTLLRPSAEQCFTTHSQGGARYASSCDKALYAPIQDGSQRAYDKQDGARMGQGSHLANNEQNKLSSEDADVKLKTQKKQNETEQSKEASRFVQNSDQRKPGNESKKNDVIESNALGVVSQKRSASSGSKPASGAAGTWTQSSENHRLEQSYHSELVGTKSSVNDKTRKLTPSSSSSAQLMPSCIADKPVCSQVGDSIPLGKNSSSNNSSSASDSTRLPPSESSFVFPSFGSPYYPMIPAPQLPAYYPNPYVWPMPFPTNASTCAYGWTAPAEITAPNCLRSPVKDPLECSMSSVDQAFNFPWMKRQSCSTTDRETVNDVTSAGKRKLECDPSDYHPPSKHPLYLSDSLRSTYGEAIGWPGYNPNAAAALDLRFLPYNIPSYIPDIRPAHGLFANNFLKGSENPSSSGLGFYPGLFPSPCLGVNSR